MKCYFLTLPDFDQYFYFLVVDYESKTLKVTREYNYMVTFPEDYTIVEESEMWRKVRFFEDKKNFKTV